jgi:hypothetical protein
VVEFLRLGPFEADHLAARRVHAAEHMADHTIFAAGVSPYALISGSASSPRA